MPKNTQGQDNIVAGNSTIVVAPTSKVQAVKALTGDDKKSFADKILAETERLAEQVISNSPTGASDAHLIKDEKLKTSAMEALEGQKWHDKRLEDEARQKIEEEKQKLLAEREEIKQKIVVIEREKEVFELQWINLNDQKTPLDKELEQTIAQELQLESEEKKIEQEEIAEDKPDARKVLEEARWQIQQNRHKAEEKKWDVQDKVSTIATAMTALSAKYQQLLAEEDNHKKRGQEIDRDIKEL